MTPDQVKLNSLKQSVAELSPSLAKRAPKQLSDLKSSLRALESVPAGKSIPEASKQKIRELFLWQLELKRKDFQSRVDAARAGAAKGEPNALANVAAFEAVLRVLEESRQAVAAPPARATVAMRQVDAAAEKAKAAVMGLQNARKTPGKLETFKIRPGSNLR